MVDGVPEQSGQPALSNGDVARIFAQIAGLLEFREENAFKVRSYSMAAETISGMANSVVEIGQRGGPEELQKIPGIGKSISGQIMEIIKTGTSVYFESLKTEIPVSVLELRRVSGIGLKTAQVLYREFGIKSLDQLRQFAEGGGLKSVRGLGEKTAARITRSLSRLAGQHPGR